MNCCFLPIHSLISGVSSYTVSQDFLGRIDCTLGEIVGSAGSMIDRTLT